MPPLFNHVGPYEIQHSIGKGGMAEVFLATDTRSGRLVALKVVPRGSDRDRESQEVIEAEQLGAELQQQFSAVSTFVPAVYETGLSDDYFYVAMEYLDGENLSALIGQPHSMPVERAVAIASDLCRFIEDADGFDATLDGKRMHSLIHGDLTPRNVRITAAGSVKILDFGIAKALSLTRKVTRNDFGNLPYLSPERLESNEVDRYTDFWAIGVVLYEMVHGQRPFSEPDTRLLERQILARRPPPSLDGDCPTGLQAVIAKLLAPSAADRYDSARAIREDLELFAAGQPTIAEQDGWPGRETAEPPTRRTKPPEGDQDATRRTTSSLVVAAGPASSLTPAAGSVQPAAIAQKAGRPIRLLFMALVLLILIMGGNELVVASAARRAADAIPNSELDGLADAWSQYDALSQRSVLRLATVRLRASLIQQTSMLADRVMANYRAPMPSVREAQWKMAREALARAVAASPSRQLRAAMRYCDGHLHRINGEAKLARHQVPSARHDLSEAVAAFREAAELRTDWPDPFLGLARTFIYGFEDVDRGADALNQAQRLGYAAGDRESAQLADGYRKQGESLWRSAGQLRGMPQERDLLTRAVEAYQQSIDLYLKVVGFAGVPANLKRAQRELEPIERRLAEVSPVGWFGRPAAGYAR